MNAYYCKKGDNYIFQKEDLLGYFINSFRVEKN